MRGARRERHDLFRAPQTGSAISLSDSLLDSALTLLWRSLVARQGGVHRAGGNHYAPDAAGSILLLVAAFEAWLNEAIFHLSVGDPDLRELANCSIRSKYYRIPERLQQGTIPHDEDLELVLKIRDEVAHFLPYLAGRESRVPPWLVDLGERGLFITSDSEVDFDFGVKLRSYRLAYWAWRTVHKAATDFLDAMGSKAKVLSPGLVNFEAYLSVCQPNSFPEYDAEHKLR